jgi:hypothetical protein
MKTVFEASNALEAYMLQDLLRQQGISARVDGALLQGAVGELPAIGLVRLVVEDEDYSRGRAVIQAWEATVVPDSIPSPPSRTPKGFIGAVVGLALGIAGSYAFFRAPATVDGVDYNEDGILDERWTYSPNGTVLESKVDRNFDGNVDDVIHFDLRGNIESIESDDDFDGDFETRWRFFAGRVRYGETDTDGDSYFDLKSHFSHGVLTSEEFMNPYSGLPIRVEYYHLGKLTTAEADTDDDGKLDKRHTYSDVGEITSTAAIEPPK